MSRGILVEPAPAYVSAFVTIITFSLLLSTAEGQSFVIQDFAPNISTTLTKTFSTRILVTALNQNQSTFNETIFIDSATSFYSGAFTGFISATVISTDAIPNGNTTSYRLNYQVSYGFSTFSTTATSDSVVRTAIGNESTVKAGLELSTTFASEYQVSSNVSDFTFSGSRICPLISCGSTNVFCNETELGLSPTCRSICFQRTICHNGAVCVHSAVATSPTCNCVASASVWYVGQYCDYKVEVWMVVVFVLGYLLIIGLIIIIGYFCYKRASKIKEPEPSPRKNEAQMKPIQRTQAATNRPENNKKPAEPASILPKNRNKSESTRAPSALTTISDEYSLIEGAAELSNTDAPADVHNNRSNDDGQSSVSLQSSSDDEDVMRPYNTLEYSDRPEDTESSRRYDLLQMGGSGNKATQTQTEIKIHLPDSVLMGNVS